jgi:hypothetical protein
MKETRYIYKTVEFSECEAQQERDNTIRGMQAEINNLRDEISWLEAAPLPTTRQIQFALNLGDEGYDEAPVGFSSLCYQGDVKWINQSSPSTQPENG